MEAQEMAVVKFNITEGAIEKMRADYLPLVIKGLDDRDGYKACDEARKVVKSHRVSVEKRRKELKEEALRFGQKIDSEAKRISGQLEQIEDHLRAQQDIIDKEAERQRAKVQAEAKAKLDARILRLQELRAQIDFNRLAAMSDEDFAELVQREAARHAAEIDAAKKQEEELRALRAREAVALEERRKAELEATRLREALIAKQQTELAEKEKEASKAKAAQAKAKAAQAKAEQERAAQQAKHEAEVRNAKEAEAKRLAKEAEGKAQAEAAARKEVADKKLFDEIQAKFPTLEACWVEIARLTKLSRGGK